MDLRYARGFDVEKVSGCDLVTIRSSQSAGTSRFRYLLVPRGRAVPGGYAGAQVIFVPVQRVVSLSTTHLAYIDAAGCTDRLVGLAGFKHVNTPSVRRLIDSGKLAEVGQFSNPDIETLFDLNADLILTPAAGSVYDVHPKLQEAGLPAVLIIDHLEAHPLGRLEWIKLMALFYGTQRHAENLFNAIAARYTNLAHKTAALPQRPKVITGAPFQGQWWVARGNSFVARFIRDAGGDYLWSRSPGTGSRPMDVEAVYEKALTAEIWLNTGSWKRIGQALSADPRFADLPALKQGLLFNNNKRLNPWGGNDFWESGMLNPDVVLADLISIVHPGLLPKHQRVYYRRLAQ